MKLCQTTADLQEEVALAKAAGKSIGLVPTMGALHECRSRRKRSNRQTRHLPL